MLKDSKILIFFTLLSLYAIFYLIKNISTQSLLAQISDFINREKNFENEISNLKEKISNLEEKVDAITEEIGNLKNLKVVVGELETKSQKVETKENQKEKEKIKICQNFDDKPKFQVIFNEICWMGDDNSPANEWIELKNISQKEIDLAGWQILNKNQRIKIVFENTKISPGEFLVLQRGDDFTGAIKNSDETLFLFDKDCNLQDKVEATSTWPAGDNETKRTAERKEDLSWQTSQDSGGTPGKENSKGLIFIEEKEEKEKIEPKITLNYPTQIFSQKEFEVLLSVSDLIYDSFDVKISILKISDESEQKRTISEISLTGEEWQDSYKYLTNIFTGNSFSGKFKLRVNQDFSGQAEIIAKIRQSLTKKIIAEFNKKIYIEKFQEIVQVSPEIQQSTEIQSPTEISSFPFLKILINEIQISGDKASYDFIELYNPNDTPIDMSGYQLKKRNKAGTESSLGVFPAGSIISAHGYFLWACSADGYDQIINADIAFKSYYLTEDNSIALFDREKNRIDAVAWGSGHIDPFVETLPFPQNPGPNQSLERINFQDTDNNSQDFQINQTPTPKR